jgi:hypothetical protein
MRISEFITRNLSKIISTSQAIIESVWALLKRGYHGVFHHFSDKHIGRYVDGILLGVFPRHSGCFMVVLDGCCFIRLVVFWLGYVKVSQ